MSRNRRRILFWGAIFLLTALVAITSFSNPYLACTGPIMVENSDTGTSYLNHNHIIVPLSVWIFCIMNMWVCKEVFRLHGPKQNDT
jgi:hypothetical protein